MYMLYLQRRALYSLLWKRSESPKTYRAYTGGMPTDKKVGFSHLSFLIVSKGLEMPAIREIYTEMMDLKHFKYSKGTRNFAKA